MDAPDSLFAVAPDGPDDRIKIFKEIVDLHLKRDPNIVLFGEVQSNRPKSIGI